MQKSMSFVFCALIFALIVWGCGDKSTTPPLEYKIAQIIAGVSDSDGSDLEGAWVFTEYYDYRTDGFMCCDSGQTDASGHCIYDFQFSSRESRDTVRVWARHPGSGLCGDTSVYALLSFTTTIYWNYQFEHAKVYSGLAQGSGNGGETDK